MEKVELDNVAQRILSYLAKATAEAGGTEPMTLHTGLIESGLVDSIGLVGLIQYVEAEFGLQIPDADLTPELFETPASVADYVARRLA